MKTSQFLIFFLFFSLISTPLFAEYYQWVDKDGVKHFTDNVLEVPENQRPGVQVYKDLQNSEIDTQESDGVIRPEEEQPPEAGEEKIPSKAEFQVLTNIKKELDSEYGSLAKKRQALLEQKKTMEIKEYNAQTEALNKQIEQFEKKRLEYEKQVLEYNNRQVDEKK